MGVKKTSGGLLRAISNNVEALSRLEIYVGSALVLPLVFYVVAGALMRYGLRIPLPGTIEIPSFTLLAFTSLGISYVLMTGGHVGVDMLVVSLPVRLQSVFNIISKSLVLTFSSFMFWASWDTALWTLREGIRSIDLGLLMFVVRVFIPIGFLTMCLQAGVEIGKTISQLRRGAPAATSFSQSRGQQGGG